MRLREADGEGAREGAQSGARGSELGRGPARSPAKKGGSGAERSAAERSEDESAHCVRGALRSDAPIGAGVARRSLGSGPRLRLRFRRFLRPGLALRDQSGRASQRAAAKTPPAAAFLRTLCRHGRGFCGLCRTEPQKTTDYGTTEKLRTPLRQPLQQPSCGDGKPEPNRAFIKYHDQGSYCRCSCLGFGASKMMHEVFAFLALKGARAHTHTHDCKFIDR